MVAPARSLVSATILVLLIGVPAAAAEAPDAEPADPEVIADHVVAIEAGDSETGFGVVVAEDDGVVTMATANHVVRRDAEELGTIVVRFRGFPGHTAEARLLDLFSGTLDLAVVEAEAPAGFEFWPNLLDTSVLMRGDAVRAVGFAGRWRIPAIPGAFRQEDIDGRLVLERLGVTPGSSGGPVVSDGGIVGLIVVDRDSQNTRAVPIAMVANAFSPDNWNIPWDLGEWEAPPTAGPTPATDPGKPATPMEQVMQIAGPALSSVCLELPWRSEDHQVNDAVAALECHPDQERIEDVGLYLFEDAVRLQDWWAERTSKVDIVRAEGDCASGEPGIQDYGRGAVACYIYDDVARVRWIDEEMLLYGSLDTHFASLPKAFRWWDANLASLAGPRD